MNRHSLKSHMVEGPVTYGFTLYLRTCDHTIWFWRCVGTAFGHFLLGSHNFMVTALGSCVKWPWEPVTIALQALSLVEKVAAVQVCFTLRLRDQWSMWMWDGCKVYMGYYMASNGSCFMATQIIFKNHLLEVGLTQNRETMALRMLTTVGLFYLPTWVDIHWNNIWLRAWSYMTSHYTWGSVTTLHDFGGVLGQPLDIFFWALIISWSQLLARVWSGPEWALGLRWSSR
jgi:hypothetical protein